MQPVAMFPVGVPEFRQAFPSAPALQGVVVSQLFPSYPVTHEHPQSILAVVPVMVPPF